LQSYDDCFELLAFASLGDAGKFEMLVSTPGAQSFINFQSTTGATPLHVAAGNGHAAVTKHLLKARCNVNLQDRDGFTPLHFRALLGNANETEQLIVARCKVNLQDKDEQAKRTGKGATDGQVGNQMEEATNA
jgi:ankyrin repeat protein